MHTGVAHKLLHSILLQIPVSAMQLQRLIAYLPATCATRCTLKHVSVANFLAMALYAVPSGDRASTICAAWRTRSRDATNPVAMFANLNCVT